MFRKIKRLISGQPKAAEFSDSSQYWDDRYKEGGNSGAGSYGRLAQFEDVYTGLKREIKEETGIDDIQILKPIRIWHLFRGFKKTAENELIGITFHCRTNEKKASYSSEHTTSRWVTPKKALEFIKVPGIKKDIKVFIKL